jgi:hypothetical protein
MGFEADFSSVNGWSDPLLNPVLGPIARRRKQARLVGRQPGMPAHTEIETAP